MPETCAIISCLKTKLDFVSLHCVPTHEIGQKWKEFISYANRDQDWKQTKKLYLCSEHFQNELFIGTTRKRIVSSGVPTLLNGKAVLENTKFVKPLPLFSKVQLPLVVPLPAIWGNDNESSSTNLSQLRFSFVEDDVHLKCKEDAMLKDEEIANLKKELELCRHEIKNLNRRLSRCEEFKRKIKDQSSSGPPCKTTKLCQQQNELSEEAVRFTEFLQWLLERLGNSSGPYPEQIKEFAFKIYYYSPKAYKSLRKAFMNTLPHPRSFNRWTSHITVSPGFLSISLDHIKQRVRNAPKTIRFSLSYDEIHIRKQIIFHGGQFQGFVNYGGLLEEKDGDKEASAALFIMATEINGSFKIPIGYFLTNGLSSELLSKAIKESLIQMKAVGAKVQNVTFDGLRANLKAVEMLGAQLNPFKSNYRSFFPHPSNCNERVYVYLDPSHMMKLFRNFFKTKIIVDNENQEINWIYIQRLHDLQLSSGLRAANKLTSRHVNFENQKMKTRLCTQTISNSVATSLRFCRKIGLDEFKGSEGTEKFLAHLDRLFDAMNSQSQGKDFKSPLSKSNKKIWIDFFEECKTYLLGLKVWNKKKKKLVPLLTTGKGTPIKGLYACITTLQMIMNDLDSDDDMTFLPTYKMGQDQLETFFSLIRSRFGFNNNPNILQLLSALRVIMCARLDGINTGNCIEQEEMCTKISCFKTVYSLLNEDLMDETEDEILEDAIPELSQFIKCIVTYIAGYVSRGLLKKLKCVDCMLLLYANDDENIDNCELICEKDNGGLVMPSSLVVTLCNVVEQKIRIYQDNGLQNLSPSIVSDAVINECTTTGLLDSLRCSSQNVHEKFYLANHIISEFIKVRFYHLAKESTLKLNPTTNRNICTKSVHFSGC